MTTDYPCRVISLSRLIIGSKGFVRPLCDSCLSKDCTNPIETRSVSILGVTEEMRIYANRHTVGIVVACEGHIS